MPSHFCSSNPSARIGTTTGTPIKAQWSSLHTSGIHPMKIPAGGYRYYYEGFIFVTDKTALRDLVARFQSFYCPILTRSRAGQLYGSSFGQTAAQKATSCLHPAGPGVLPRFCRRTRRELLPPLTIRTNGRSSFPSIVTCPMQRSYFQIPAYLLLNFH